MRNKSARIILLTLLTIFIFSSCLGRGGSPQGLEKQRLPGSNQLNEKVEKKPSNDKSLK